MTAGRRKEPEAGRDETVGRRDATENGREETVGRRDETEAERADRNLNELLQELRVAQTGVQILFAFLLILPLQSRFGTLNGWERGLAAAALLTMGVATACLIAPVAYHRMLFRQRMKDEVVRAADRLAKLGLAALGLGIVLSLWLALGLLLPRVWAWVSGGVIGVLIVVLWWVLPGFRRVEHAERDGRWG